MASSIMKRAVALQQAQQKNAVATPPPTPATAPPAPVPVPAPVPPAAKATAPRSALLTGANVERWLGEQVSAHLKDKSTRAPTKARYAQVAVTLDVTPPERAEAADT